MWSRENRGLYERKGVRYPSDLRDAEWALIAPLIPPAKRGGRRREVDVREVMNGVLYVLGTGCQWRALPKDLPPKSTVHDYLMLWDWDGTLGRVHQALYLMVRHSTLEPGILLLQILKPPGLIDLETPVLPAPTIVTLL